MRSAALDTTTGESFADIYHRQGFVFPVDVVSVQDGKEIRADLEAAEAECAEDEEKLHLLHYYPNQLLPSFDGLTRHPNLIAAVSQILGEDLMVWNSALFIKEANSPYIVSWHQDLTYWCLDDVDEVTCWLALSPATRESGCMRFVPGSHKTQIVPHQDTFDPNNLLSRGQEISVDVDEGDGVDIVLQTGQASMHHGHLFHSSGPNTSDDRRIGVAIRYIRPSMRQETGDKSLVTLVHGRDDYGNFKITDAPKSRMSETDLALCREDTEIKRRILYKGAKRGEKGARF